MTVEQFLITIEVPSSWKPEEVAKQIEEDVGSWAGSKHPADRMYDLAEAKRYVSHIKRNKFKTMFFESIFFEKEKDE